MKYLLLILLFGWNVCVGQPVCDKSCVVVSNADGDYSVYYNGELVIKNDKKLTAQDLLSFGSIQYTIDKNKGSYTVTEPGYRVTKLHGEPEDPIIYFDLKGKQLFVQRFKKGKFLNFYQ